MGKVETLFNEVTDELNKKSAERWALQGMMAEKQATAEDMAKDVQGIADCVATTQKFSESIQSGIIGKFEDLLTRGVREIFDKDYKVKIEFSAPGNTLSAEFYVILPDGKMVNMAKGEGGGLRDLVAVLQRILYLILEPSQPAKVIFMDEALKFLDVDRAPLAFSFLKDLCSELGIQAIWVSHHRAIAELEGQGVKMIGIGARD